MNRGRVLGRSAGLVLAATALTIGSASISSATAAANTATASCSTTGAKGSSKTTFTPGEIHATMPVTLTVTDTSADGHHVRVRYLSRSDPGTITRWSWHALHNGNGTTLVYPTTARHEYGIVNMGVEVARFEGSTLLNSCTDWAF